MSKSSETPDPAGGAKTALTDDTLDLLADAWVAELLAAQPDEVMPDAVADRVLASLEAAQRHRETVFPAPTSDPSDLVALRTREGLLGPAAGPSSIARQAVNSTPPED